MGMYGLLIILSVSWSILCKTIVGNEKLLVIYLEGSAAVINVKCQLLHFEGNYFSGRHNLPPKEQSQKEKLGITELHV